MRMRAWVLGILRAVFIAVAAWLAFKMLEPDGLGWLVLVAAAGGALVWVGLRYAKIRRRRAEDARADRCAEALMDPPLRPRAVEELRSELAKHAPGGRGALPHARLTLVLAELLEADGDPAGALDALRAVKEDALPERTRAMVRHARAVASLSAGDVEGAAAAMDELDRPTGDRVLDLRVRSLRGLLAAERGEGGRALEIAEELRIEAGSDAELRMDARVLKAVALDVLGQREDALKVMRGLGEEMLGVLLVLGLPRVKKLADEALDVMD